MKRTMFILFIFILSINIYAEKYKYNEIINNNVTIEFYVDTESQIYVVCNYRNQVISNTFVNIMQLYDFTSIVEIEKKFREWTIYSKEKKLEAKKQIDFYSVPSIFNYGKEFHRASSDPRIGFRFISKILDGNITTWISIQPIDKIIAEDNQFIEAIFDEIVLSEGQFYTFCKYLSEDEITNALKIAEAEQNASDQLK